MTAVSRQHLVRDGQCVFVDTSSRSCSRRGSCSGYAVLRGEKAYHGPGQLVAYVMLNLERRALTPRKLVQALEGAVIDTVAGYGLAANARRDAPGVYVAGAKIAAVGLRVKRHCSYHGLAVNVAMDIAPFSGINPCGYAHLPVTDLRALAGIESIERFRADFEPRLLAKLAPCS